MSERLGILGGTFDPVHVAHLVIAVEARQQLRLDRVMLVVAGDPWQKSGSVLASADARLAMTAAAVTSIEGLEASDIEIARGGTTYTADTVAQLADADRELFLILGADAAAGLSSWQRTDEIREAVTLAIVNRGCEQVAMPPDTSWRAVAVSVPRLDISSTDLRDRVRRGAPIAGLVPSSAIRVIRELGLYNR